MDLDGVTGALLHDGADGAGRVRCSAPRGRQADPGDRHPQGAARGIECCVCRCAGGDCGSVGTRLLSSLLFGVHRIEPLTFAGRVRISANRGGVLVPSASDANCEIGPLAGMSRGSFGKLTQCTALPYSET